MFKRIKHFFNPPNYGAKFFRSVILIFSIWQIAVIVAIGLYLYYNDLALRKEMLRNLTANLNLILETTYANYLETRYHIPDELQEEFFINTAKIADEELRKYFYSSINTIIGPKPALTHSAEDMLLYQEINFPPFKLKYSVGFFKDSLYLWYLRLILPLAIFTLLITVIGIFVLYRLYRSFRKPMENLVISLREGKVPEFSGYTELDQVVQAVREYIDREKKATEEKIELLKELEKNLRLSALGTMAGAYAHEFNNLLQTVLINVELAKRALSSGDLQKVGAYLNPVEAVSKRGQELAKKILYLTMITPGDEASLREVLLEMQDVLRVMVPRDIELYIEVDDSPLYVPLSPDTLQEIVINYIKNSVDAIEGVREKERAFQISIRAYREGNFAVLEVRDNGCGMTEEVKERIFEPFFTTKKSPHGTGLGLYVIYNLVKQAGGYIKVESAPGEGTRFLTYIPLVEKRTKSAEIISETERVDQSTGALKRVLIVDDEKEIAEALKEVFSLYQIDAKLATDGKIAYELIKKEKFDLILVDLYMPGMSGIDLVKKLQNNHPVDTPIILMTGYVGEAGGLLSEMLERGLIKRILKKPFSIEEIENLIKSYMRMAN